MQQLVTFIKLQSKLFKNGGNIQNFCSKYGTLTLENMNPGVRDMEYVIKGPLSTRADEIAAELEGGAKKEFPYVIHANIDDPHSKDQKPITFFRQVKVLFYYFICNFDYHPL